MTATMIAHQRDTAPHLAVLRLLDPIMADPNEHPDELAALAEATLNRAIDAETADERASTLYFLTGDDRHLDFIGGDAA